MARIKEIHITTTKIEQLIKGCKQNDQHCQRALFEKYAPLVFTTCRRYASSHYSAKDLMQDTFIKAFEKINQFDTRKGKFESWITRIAINLALNVLRKQKLIFAELKSDVELYAVPNETTSNMSEMSEEAILSLINRLPTGYKAIFNLYVIDGFTHREIAKQLKISVSTSKSQLFKAKKMLRTQIQQIQRERYG